MKNQVRTISEESMRVVYLRDSREYALAVKMRRKVGAVPCNSANRCSHLEIAASSAYHVSSERIMCSWYTAS